MGDKEFISLQEEEGEELLVRLQVLLLLLPIIVFSPFRKCRHNDYFSLACLGLAQLLSM